jgi:hypothetical protein
MLHKRYTSKMNKNGAGGQVGVRLGRIYTNTKTTRQTQRTQIETKGTNKTAHKGTIHSRMIGCVNNTQGRWRRHIAKEKHANTLTIWRAGTRETGCQETARKNNSATCTPNSSETKQCSETSRAQHLKVGVSYPVWQQARSKKWLGKRCGAVRAAAARVILMKRGVLLTNKTAELGE